MARKADRFPKAKSYPDRHGKRRWRYREKGFTAELGAEWGSEEFCRCRRYAAAENREKAPRSAGASRTVPGTLNDLIAKFYALHFPTIEESTRNDYRALIEPLREQHGHKRVAHIRSPHARGCPGADRLLGAAELPFPARAGMSRAHPVPVDVLRPRS
ncbi:hypothetical protein [Cereibacter sphaeroides]|uniref:hypothetical protein n=1 Tax=Cereibacter sphaeroides TaxID=1063 RepID=UPI000F545331|nr:hypothetical protein [Cereibacter sphaeroides]